MSIESPAPETLLPETATETLRVAVPIPLSRRQFLSRSLALLGATATGRITNEANFLEVTLHRVPLRGLSQPLRVVQLSDLHRSWCVSEHFIRRIVAQTNALSPDLVLLTGDFVTRTAAYAPSCAQCLRELRSRFGLYGVPGNHDYLCDGRRGVATVAEELAKVGVRLLVNRSERLSNGLVLAGVDDKQEGQPDVQAAFQFVQPGEPTIAMTHNPRMFTQLQQYDCVTLAGHLHGGQINVPGITPRLLSIYNPYFSGWYRGTDGPGRLYISRGLGVIGVPLRFRAVPEIALLDLTPA